MRNIISIVMLMVFGICTSMHSQERGDFYQANAYQITSISKLIRTNDNGVSEDLSDVDMNNFMIADLTMDLGNLYIRLDASFVFPALFSENYYVPFNGTMGYWLFKENPIQITPNSNMIFGVGAFFDSQLLRLKDTYGNGEEAPKDQIQSWFTTIGLEFAADYQYSDWLKVQPKYIYGSLDDVKKSEFRMMFSFKPFGDTWEQWFTITPTFGKITGTGTNTSQTLGGKGDYFEVSSNSILIGIAKEF